MRLKSAVAKVLKGVGAATLRPIGLIPAHRTRRETVQAFLDGLHPVDSGHPLIRLGPARDGGYLVPDDLRGITACLSAGVGRDSGFELDCANRGMDVFLTDASVAGPACEHERFRFQPMHLGPRDTATTTTLDRWAHESAGHHHDDLLLKIDIEGAEFDVLPGASDATMARARIVVIEFHELQRLFVGAAFPMLRAAFDRLTTTHACVHIHPNNCCDEVTDGYFMLPRNAEFTFLRRDRLQRSTPLRVFTHPLDADCTSRPSLVLSPRLFSDRA
ncbi:MAG: hypothetical protein RI900_757 [Actinomycetota bacterium]|jgi:FkbM family methyltransferase